MGDIDFDELDKAVNSLMGKVTEKTTDDQDKLKTLDIKDTLKPDEKPKYDALGKAAQGIGGETLELVSEHEILEDLTKSESADDVRELKTDQSDSNEKDKPEDSDKDEAEDTKEAPVEKTKAPAVRNPRVGRFMDMVPQSTDKRLPVTTPDLVVPARHEPTAAASTTVMASATPPGQSPFLTDAKVEKRPLGGESSIDTSLADVDIEDQPVEIESINNEEKSIDNGSGDEQRALDASGFNEASAEQEQKLQAIEATEAKEQVAESIIAVESGDTEKILASGSKNASESTGNIYDVNNLHQPLGHPVKQKSGWGVVFIIVIIIVLAVAIAGAAYVIFVKP